MSLRWTIEEQNELREVRERLGPLLKSRPQFPEVVGDRKLLRFLRGHNHDLNKACQMIEKFLNWRTTNNIDKIRENIVSGIADKPSKFPKGELILQLIKQVVILPSVCDNRGMPICIDQYAFSPIQVLTKVSLEEYIEFTKYALEYRQLILEQMSEEREREVIASRTAAKEIGQAVDESQPYGVIVLTCVIRDLAGITMESMGSKGQEIVKSVIAVSGYNYPQQY